MAGLVVANAFYTQMKRLPLADQPKISQTLIEMHMNPTSPTHALHRVAAWTNGDCDGDGRLTAADIEAAEWAIMLYHRSPGLSGGSRHSANPNARDQLVHASILQALGLRADAALSVLDADRFRRTIEARIREAEGLK